MRVSVSITALVLGFLALSCGMFARAQPQQPNTPAVIETFPSAYAKANQECNALWSDHAFDWLRTKIPLGEAKPTFSMLTNKEKLRSKDRPIADLAIKTLGKCRSAYASAYSMLPPQAYSLIQEVGRKQDALIAKLYKQKITLGDFNVAIDLLVVEFREAISKIPNSPIPNTAAASPQPPAKDAKSSMSSQQRTELPPSAPTIERFHDVRIALVIGNSDYANLPKLSNPANDARSIAEVLEKMGYRTKLLLDASDQSIRSEVRKFASESSKANVAIVYYAGHGAQLNGNNYLLPTDIEIPRTEADIQFAGLKVDDLVNSIGSNTKIVFLDACRDNPALFKNIVKGRGASAVGLAPASASALNPATPGGGVFIAYATDAGAVADDGHGQHSPFTQAILHFMQKPVSIDDMFSLVTREVRLVTKDAQRPYKYASLENIICLTPNCSPTVVPAVPDILQQAKRSEDEDLQIALQTNSANALESYLQKYPQTTQRSDLLKTIGSLRRSEFTGWTLYEIGNRHMPNFLQISSVQNFTTRGAARVKVPMDPSLPPPKFQEKTFPDAAYLDEVIVYDCAGPAFAISEESIFNEAGALLFHYKWRDPEYLDLAIGGKIEAHTIGSTTRSIVCHDDLATPLVSKQSIAEGKFNLLASTTGGDGELLYRRSESGQKSPTQLEVLFLVRFFADHNVKEFFPSGFSIPDPPNYRTEVDRVIIRCDENKSAITRTEYWNASNELVRMAVPDPDAPISFSEFPQFSPFGTLQEMYCGKGYGGLGLRYATENGSEIVAEVFAGSPAEKAGVKANDVVTHIDGEPVAGLTAQQIVEKSRGPAGTQVVLTILRKGGDGPTNVTVVRENIRPQSAQVAPPK